VKVLVLMGATATGKSGLALRLAEDSGREIISADSRQIYRGLRIGTAQPSSSERTRVVHHLVDFLSPEENWSAQEFADAALAVIRSRSVAPPLVVGGTGFWLRSMMQGLFPLDIPREATLAARARLEADDTENLQARLARVDPESADRLHAKDRQRILRALEVFEATGRILSEHHRLDRRKPEGIDWRPVVLQVARKELHRRIEIRLDAMLEQGWVEEVKALLGSGLDPEAAAMKTLGYPEITAVLKGELKLEEARERILYRTRQYARRQEIWFRREEGLRVDPDDPSTPERLAHLLES